MGSTHILVEFTPCLRRIRKQGSKYVDLTLKEHGIIENTIGLDVLKRSGEKDVE